ncbi:MAG: glycosyltransferase family 2 protein [Gammaproteobacteria bacterium]|nr:glycosyltransferase family 2 protein [Gammaproteobacteria bacterium]
MTTTVVEWLVFVLVAGPSLVWLLTLLVIPIHSLRIPRLSEQAIPAGELPSLGIVIAARNEAHTIEPAIRSVLAQDYPRLEVIAVNDRSDDGTGELLDRLAVEHAHLSVIHVDRLPAGWLGKNHALQRGLEAATTDYVLFTDADVHFQPGSLQRALGYMRDQEFDHLSSIPELVNARASMQLMMPAFSVFFLMMTRPWHVSNPDSDSHMGVGAFNLVRREPLLAIGGLEKIRLRPDDDLMLGKLVKQHRLRSGYAASGGDIAVQWYTTAGETIHGLEKNAFAQFDYSPLKASVMLVLTLLLSLGPVVGLAAWPAPTGLVALGGTLAMLATAAILSWLVKLNPAWGLLFPIGATLVVYACLRSMVLALMRGGIIWRDTFYSLADLRSNRR